MLLQTRPPASVSAPIVLPGTSAQIHPQMPLADYTTYRVGGAAQWYAAPRNCQELEAAFDWFGAQDLPLTLLGAGSNLLISDQGVAGLVVSARHLRGSSFDEERGVITASAGEPIAKIAWQAAKRGWGGLEWAVGIPGTVGGAVVMNAGAHNHCAAEVLTNAAVMTPEGRVETLTPEELGFSYRTSRLQGDRRMVVEASFQLRPGHSREEIMTATTRNLHARKSSQPYDKPSCGSVFRNPTPQYAAQLIECLGLKGYRIGGAEVSERHANFILNAGNAKAQDIFNLIRHVQAEVAARRAVNLEPEVKILGQFAL